MNNTVKAAVNGEMSRPHARRRRVDYAARGSPAGGQISSQKLIPTPRVLSPVCSVFSSVAQNVLAPGEFLKSGVGITFCVPRKGNGNVGVTIRYGALHACMGTQTDAPASTKPIIQIARLYVNTCHLFVELHTLPHNTVKPP